MKQGRRRAAPARRQHAWFSSLLEVPSLSWNTAVSLAPPAAPASLVSLSGERNHSLCHWKAEVSQKTSFCCRTEGLPSCSAQSDVEEIVQELVSEITWFSASLLPSPPIPSRQEAQRFPGHCPHTLTHTSNQRLS